jgi:hypothetical protein
MDAQAPTPCVRSSMAPRIFPAPPTAPFFPKRQEQPLPFFLQRPVRFSSSRLPFFTWPNTAPCPWMQQQQPPLLPHKTAAPDSLHTACFTRSAQCAVDARCVLDEMCSKSRVVDFLQQPRRLRALRARCFIKRSEQHAVDARRVFAVFAQPHPRRR